MTKKTKEIEIPYYISLKEVLERLLEAVGEEIPSLPIGWIIGGGTRYPRS